MARPTISKQTIARIERLCRAGASTAETAAAVGCSLNTVRTVIRGGHPLQQPEPRPVSEWEWDDELGEELLPREELARPVRCDGCGALTTQKPCVLCRCGFALTNPGSVA